MHNGRSVDKCIFKLTTIAHACQASICFQLEKGLSHTCIQLAVNQPEQKLVDVVAATVEAASLQPPTAMAKGSYLSSPFRLGRADIGKCKCQSYSSSTHLPNYPLNTLAA